MPDISMCRNKECTLKENCYRFTAKAEELWQTYSEFTQYKDGKCDYFWDNYSKKCKHVKKEGESCTLNDKCTYPNCYYKN
jgi:histone deacetylase complex regulatory component SIN3